jgi:hypothetical protein
MAPVPERYFTDDAARVYRAAHPARLTRQHLAQREQFLRELGDGIEAVSCPCSIDVTGGARTRPARPPRTKHLRKDRGPCVVVQRVGIVRLGSKTADGVSVGPISAGV